MVFKLAKKYSGDTPMSRPMTNLYLDAAEFELLGRLPGRRVFKWRFQIDNGFIVDVFDGALAGLILGEIEANLALVSAVAMPGWAAAEVTNNPHYDGGSISHWTTDDLAAHRVRYG